MAGPVISVEAGLAPPQILVVAEGLAVTAEWLVVGLAVDAGPAVGLAEAGGLPVWHLLLLTRHAGEALGHRGLLGLHERRTLLRTQHAGALGPAAVRPPSGPSTRCPRGISRCRRQSSVQQGRSSPRQRRRWRRGTRELAAAAASVAAARPPAAAVQCAASPPRRASQTGCSVPQAPVVLPPTMAAEHHLHQ